VRAVVRETREVAEGTLLALFAVEDYPDYRPGAYFWVELPDRGHDDEKGLRRHISLVTSPTEHGVVGLATRLRDTAFKRTLAEL
jgi:ferredoxin-NADP reductase